MPRKNLPPRKAQAALLAIKLEKARYEIRALRRAEREREAAIALRKATPDWVEMDARLKQLQLEAEMDAMEAAIDERRPKIPILNFDLMPGFEPPDKSQTIISKSGTPKPEPEKHPAKEHPDVAEQRRLTALEAEIKRAQETSTASNQNSPPPPPSHLSDKNWKYDSIADGYEPADDWRNYE